MLHQLWASAIQMSNDALPTVLGMAAMSYGIARANLQTVEAVMLAAALLLVVIVI